MKIKKDLSGLDSFIQEVEDEINQDLIDAAHKAIDTQKVKNESSKKTYENHTWNLRNAPGAAVVRDGEIIDLYIQHKRQTIINKHDLEHQRSTAHQIDVGTCQAAEEPHL